MQSRSMRLGGTCILILTFVPTCYRASTPSSRMRCWPPARSSSAVFGSKGAAGACATSLGMTSCSQRVACRT